MIKIYVESNVKMLLGRDVLGIGNKKRRKKIVIE